LASLHFIKIAWRQPSEKRVSSGNGGVLVEQKMTAIPLSGIAVNRCFFKIFGRVLM
jgi:hypothetical protein